MLSVTGALRRVTLVGFVSICYLSPYITTREEGENKVKASFNPKGWTEQQMLKDILCNVIRSIIGAGHRNRRKSKMCVCVFVFFLNQQNSILLFCFSL